MQNEIFFLNVENSVADAELFEFPGSKILFKLLTTASEMQYDNDIIWQKFGVKKKTTSFKGLLTNLAQAQAQENNVSNKTMEPEQNKTDTLGELSMSKLAAVETILGGTMPTFDAKSDHEQVTANAKVKAKKLFGDAHDRKYAKKKEKEKKGEYIWELS